MTLEQWQCHLAATLNLPSLGLNNEGRSYDAVFAVVGQRFVFFRRWCGFTSGQKPTQDVLKSLSGWNVMAVVSFSFPRSDRSVNRCGDDDSGGLVAWPHSRSRPQLCVLLHGDSSLIQKRRLNAEHVAGACCSNGTWRGNVIGIGPWSASD